jgi:phage terminase large subunit-like protein
MADSVLQASQAFNFIHGAIEGSSHLSRLIESVTADTISLASGVNIQVRPASFRTIRGISAVGAICDEIAFFRSDDAKIQMRRSFAPCARALQQRAAR